MSIIDLPDETLSKMWKEFKWSEIEQELLKLQKELTLAVLKKHHREIKRW